MPKDSPNQAKRRQEMIAELRAIGMFDALMAMGVHDEIVGVAGCNPGRFYQATYLQFQLENKEAARAYGVDEETGLVLALVSIFDVYGLRMVVDDAKESGVRVAYARLLGSALQETTGLGDAVETLSRMNRGTWVEVYAMLKSQRWTPDIPMKTPDATMEETPERLPPNGAKKEEFRQHPLRLPALLERIMSVARHFLPA